MTKNQPTKQQRDIVKNKEKKEAEEAKRESMQSKSVEDGSINSNKRAKTVGLASVEWRTVGRRVKEQYWLKSGRKVNEAGGES